MQKKLLELHKKLNEKLRVVSEFDLYDQGYNDALIDAMVEIGELIDEENRPLIIRGKIKDHDL